MSAGRTRRLGTLGRRGGLATVAFPVESARAPRVRVAPGDRRALGTVNWLVCAVLGRVTGTGPPHVFTTLGRHRRLFRAWLRFAGRLMPFGTIPRAEAELVILRVAVLCGSDYEWHQHVAIGQRAGLTAEQVARVGDGPDAPGWSEREQALLRAADELAAGHAVTEETWAALTRAGLDERQRMELCLLAGHYAMLAGALNSLGVAPERAS